MVMAVLPWMSSLGVLLVEVVSVPAVARPDQPVTLSWVLADPSAAVEIDNGIGNSIGNLIRMTFRNGFTGK